MATPLTLTVPHSSGQDEAVRRVKAGIASLGGQFAGKLALTREDWTGGHCDFTLTALGQSVAGAIEVGEASIALSVQLPWLLRAFQAKASALIEARGRAMLAAP